MAIFGNKGQDGDTQDPDVLKFRDTYYRYFRPFVGGYASMLGMVTDLCGKGYKLEEMLRGLKSLYEGKVKFSSVQPLMGDIERAMTENESGIGSVDKHCPLCAGTAYFSVIRTGYGEKDRIIDPSEDPYPTKTLSIVSCECPCKFPKSSPDWLISRSRSYEALEEYIQKCLKLAGL